MEEEVLKDAVGDVRLLWDGVVLVETVKEGLRVREEVVEEDADSVGVEEGSTEGVRVELGAPVLDFWTEKVEMSVVVLVRVGRALAVGLREKEGLGEDVPEAPC